MCGIESETVKGIDSLYGMVLLFTGQGRQSVMPHCEMVCDTILCHGKQAITCAIANAMASTLTCKYSTILSTTTSIISRTDVLS